MKDDRYINIDEGKCFVQVHFLKENNNFCLYMVGAPSLFEKKKVGSLLKKGYNVVIPEYIGSKRTDGVFSPENCIRTIEETLKYVKRKWGWGEGEGNKKMYIGSSFGALWFPYVKGFDSCILLAPIINPNCLGKEERKESDIDDFFEQIFNSYYNLYRGVKKNEWLGFFDKHEEMYLAAYRGEITILHGKKDNVVNYNRSLRLSKKNKIRCFLYPFVTHNSNALLQKIKKIL